MNTSASVLQRANNDWLVGQRVDRYDILFRLAAGGMGAVYVARALGLGGFERLVAIKVLHPHLAEEEEFITMLLDEARLAARMRHPNVVSTLDVAQWQDLHYLVMDYVEGDHIAGLMKSALAQGKKLPQRGILRIMVEALSGLGAAHDLTDDRGNKLNLVHRDVSPQNILIGTDGIARLTDFGVAKAEYRLSSTRQGTFKGKLSYTAPETASSAHAEQRSDLFAMGVVLWEALTTSRLFKGENNVATLRMLLEEPIPRPSSIDPALAPFDPVLAKALARPVEDRFQTAAEMIDAVELVAAKVDGIGTTREVAELVRTLAADKLGNEQRGIRAAIERASVSGPKVYSTGRNAAVDVDIPVSDSQPPTLTARGDQPVQPPRSRVVLYSMVGLAIALVGGAVWLALRPNEAATGEPSEYAGPATGTVTAPGESATEMGAAPETGTTGPETDTPSGAPETGMAAGETGTAAETGTVAQTGAAGETGTAEVGASGEDLGETPSMSGRRRPTMRGTMRGAQDDDVLSNPYRQE